ncbi:MAG TPA: ImmA/IrrE family metallo-endopeptidase [Synergistaceae bacterium]|nr:ImmA/IrrE family metallo-endopeptidase [Synergistaceae bacterium]
MPPENNQETEAFSESVPQPPEVIPQWAVREGREWQRLSEFDILAKAEEITGLSLELIFEQLPAGVWGIHIVRGKRGRIYINASLPLIWRRFAIFHETYHLLNHRKGHRFWTHTFASMESFENRADTFAWAVIWPEWSEGDYRDWA